MTLEYSILWVDDSPDWVAPVRDEIENYLDSNGLSAKINFFSDGEGIECVLSKESIDLIILDNTLPGRNGDELIKVVRNGGEITEIVFYSQDDQSTNDVTKWDGVQFILRDDAETIIKEVIDGFINRNKSMAIMRGVIIAEAIDVENKLTEIIKKIFGAKSDLFKDKILDKAWIDFSKKSDLVQSCLNDKLAQAKQDTPTDTALIDRITLCCSTMKGLKGDVINQRNILAHSEKSFDADGHLVLMNLSNTTPKRIVFDDVWKNSIRQNMKKHRLNLQEILDLI